jgi:hypothetical protein
MSEEVTFQECDYRLQGGQFQRRLKERDRMKPEDSAWLVLDHGESIPQVVRDHFARQNGNLRFD